MKKPPMRINKTTGMFMLIVAFAFDLAQLFGQLFVVFGLTILTTVVGSAVGGTIGAVIGAAVGGFISLTGIGTAFAFFVGVALSWAFCMFVAIVGYFTMVIWLMTKGVSPFGSGKLTIKIVAWLISGLIDFLPFLSALPGLTFWTFLMIRVSRAEDNVRAELDERLYNISTRRMKRRKVAANDNEPLYEDRAEAA